MYSGRQKSVFKTNFLRSRTPPVQRQLNLTGGTGHTAAADNARSASCRPLTLKVL